MLSFREIRINDRDLFCRMQKDLDYENNEGSFATLYLWRRRWKIRICSEDGVIYIESRLPEDGRLMHYQPVVPGGGSVLSALRTVERDLAFRGAPLLVKYANEQFVSRIREEGGTQYGFAEARDDFDYVYSARELSTLEGRKFHGQRNHLNRFLRDSDPRYEDLAPAHLSDCLAVYDRWMALHAGTLREEGERMATREAVENMDALGLMGGIAYVAGTPVAFTVGEAFRPDMAIVHLEKADPAFHGAFQYINQQFAYRRLGDFAHINRQEDMGLEGIRKAKMAYHPIRMIRKYDVFRT